MAGANYAYWSSLALPPTKKHRWLSSGTLYIPDCDTGNNFSVYIPGLLQLQADLAINLLPAIMSNSQPEDVELWLPSGLPTDRRRAASMEGLPEMENKLRMAQCHDALDNVWHILCIKARMVEFKNKHIQGQRDGTHSQSVIDRVHARARIAAEKYRAARTAKLALVGGGDWEAMLQPLKDSDLRAYSDPSWLKRRRGRQGMLEDGVMEGLAEIGGEDQRDEGELGELGGQGGQGGMGDRGIDLFPEVRKQKDGTEETRRILSWIWITMPIELAEGQNDDLLRSEWAKSRVRATWAMEEILLLREEMRCVLGFLRWKAD
jgi:hypothetical protein